MVCRFVLTLCGGVRSRWVRASRGSSAGGSGCRTLDVFRRSPGGVRRVSPRRVGRGPRLQAGEVHALDRPDLSRHGRSIRGLTGSPASYAIWSNANGAIWPDTRTTDSDRGGTEVEKHLFALVAHFSAARERGKHHRTPCPPTQSDCPPTQSDSHVLMSLSPSVFLMSLCQYVGGLDLAHAGRGRG